MFFPVWLLHVSRACTALPKHGVGVEPPFWPDFWDRGRACARGGGYVCSKLRDLRIILRHTCWGTPPPQTFHLHLRFALLILDWYRPPPTPPSRPPHWVGTQSPHPRVEDFLLKRRICTYNGNHQHRHTHSLDAHLMALPLPPNTTTPLLHDRPLIKQQFFRLQTLSHGSGITCCARPPPLPRAALRKRPSR